MPLKITRKGGRLWIEGRMLGVQVRRSTGLSAGFEREAETMRLDIEREIVNGTFHKQKTKKHSFEEAAESYLAWKRLSKHDTKGIERHVAIILPHFKGMMVEDMDHDAVQKVIASQWSGLKPGSIARYITQIVSVMKHAGDRWGFAPAKIMRPTVDDARDAHFDAKEANEFLAWVREHHPHYEPHFTVLIDCGLRLNEMLRMTKRDMAGDVMRMTRRSIGNGKTETRVIPLTDTVKSLAKGLPDKGAMFRKPSGDEWASSNDASSYLGKVLKQGCRELGLPELRVHDLRHTFAYLVAQAGADVADLQTLLGHEDISNTMRYRGFVLSRAKQFVTSARVHDLHTQPADAIQGTVISKEKQKDGSGGRDRTYDEGQQ